MRSIVAASAAPLLFALFACGSAAVGAPAPSPSDTQPVAAPAAKADAPSGKSLGHLQTRDHKLTLFASPAGLRVTVRAHDGTVLADRVDVEDLRDTQPALYQLCRSALAAGSGYLDATLDRRPASADPSRGDSVP
jgi:hypothetical protein